MRILSVDYGDSRTGLAVCDPSEIIVSPLTTVFEKDFEKCVSSVAKHSETAKAELIVVGDPINMNGTRGPRSEKCRVFAEKLREKVSVKVVMWDERSTTVTAASIMNQNNKRGEKRKQSIDSAAAGIILETFLAYKKNNPDAFL